MAVDNYKISLLSLKECCIQQTPANLIELLKIWRKNHSSGHVCTRCQKKLSFRNTSYTICCKQFYYDDRRYSVKSIAVPTPGYSFTLNILQKYIKTSKIKTNQDFLIIPDPVYWQVSCTLEFEKAMKFVQALPMTKRSSVVHPPSKVETFYNNIMKAPLNYGSIQHRSSGKNTFMRQVIFGKRCILSMRGMIVPDSSLKPNEIRLPEDIVSKFQLLNKWVILNRMPSLQPGNFVGLYVSSKGWKHDAIGTPLECLSQINGDYDGDECNILILKNISSQAECATLLNPETNLGCFVMRGPKLLPTQDMLVAYFLKYDQVDFLPYKTKDLNTTFQVLYDHYGSKQTFQWIDQMRLFYLQVLQNELCYALTLEEMTSLYAMGRQCDLEEFQKKAESSDGCLVTQIKCGAKGSYEHLYQMFGKVGYQDEVFIQNSFWDGLNAVEAVSHAKMSTNALSKMCKIWQPGYGYTKMVFNLQGIHVDYQGRLLDGEVTVIENDVLNALHYTDLMSEEGFKHLLEKHLIN